MRYVFQTVQLFTLTFIVKYHPAWLDVIVDQLAHAWNSSITTGLLSHEDMLVKTLAGAEQDQAVNIVGGISIQSRFQYDIQTEFIHNIFRYQPVLAQIPYIIMFHGILNVVHEGIVHVTVVFHVHIRVHVQLRFTRQLRHNVQVNMFHDIITGVVHAHVFTIVHVILLVAMRVAVYAHVFR